MTRIGIAFATAACFGIACSSSTEAEPAADAGNADANTSVDSGSTATDSGATDAPRPEAGTARRLETKCTSDPCYLGVSGAGAKHHCGLLQDGTVRCWGPDTERALGRGHAATPLEGATPAPVAGLSAVTQISVGKNLGTCARTSDGSVFCWGRNEYGQLGRPSSATSLAVPTRVEGLPAISFVALGGSTGCAIASEDGALYCWGAIAASDEGTPARPPQRMADFRPPIRSLAIGTANNRRQYSDTIVAHLEGGVLATLGACPAGASSVQPDFSPIPVELPGVARAFEFAYVAADGLLRSWVPSTHALYISQPSSVVDAAIVAGVDSSGELFIDQGAVLLSTGRLFRWGLNTSGMLGSPPEQLDFAEQPLDMTAVTGNQIVSFATTETTTCVSLADGKVRCWGGNERGELGRGTLDLAAHPEAEEIR